MTKVITPMGVTRAYYSAEPDEDGHVNSSCIPYCESHVPNLFLGGVGVMVTDRIVCSDCLVIQHRGDFHTFTLTGKVT